MQKTFILEVCKQLKKKVENLFSKVTWKFFLDSSSLITIVATAPVLYTVGLEATFWNMNSSVWAGWAAQGSKKKNGFFVSKIM